MKTIKNLIGKICTFPNAIKAYMKARKCKRLRPEVLEFEQNREDNLQKAIDAIDWNLIAAMIYACKEADEYEKN